MRTLYLVSCVSVKLPRAAEAQDLYVSPWFVLARRYVQSMDASGVGPANYWGILSARHGFVTPRTYIEPYEETLNTKSDHENWTWAKRTLTQIAQRYGTDSFDHYVILAGRRYAKYLAPPLRAELPLKGLGIGQQLAWFKRNTRHAPITDQGIDSVDKILSRMQAAPTAKRRTRKQDGPNLALL